MTQSPRSKEEEATFHAERRTGIGASEMADLFSLPSPYVTLPQAGGCERKIWYSKRGTPVDFERITKPSMQRGTDCEEIVARKLAEATGWRITKRKEMLRHPELPFIIAHVDREATGRGENREGWWGLPGGKRLAAELKTMNGHVAKKVAKVGLSDGYLLQMQAILLAGNGRYAAGAFAVMDLDAWELLPPIFIEHDYAVQDRIREKAASLWAQIKDPHSAGPAPLASLDQRCSECPWRTKCQQIT